MSGKDLQTAVWLAVTALVLVLVWDAMFGV